MPICSRGSTSGGADKISAWITVIYGKITMYSKRGKDKRQ